MPEQCCTVCTGPLVRPFGRKAIQKVNQEETKFLEASLKKRRGGLRHVLDGRERREKGCSQKGREPVFCKSLKVGVVSVTKQASHPATCRSELKPGA